VLCRVVSIALIEFGIVVGNEYITGKRAKISRVAVNATLLPVAMLWEQLCTASNDNLYP